MTDDRVIKVKFRRVGSAIYLQNPETGEWKYRPGLSEAMDQFRNPEKNEENPALPE